MKRAAAFPRWLLDGLNLATGRKVLPPGARLAPAFLLALLLLPVLVGKAAEWLIASGSIRFDIYGVNASLAWAATTFVVVLLFARRDGSGRTLGQLVLLTSWALTAMALLWAALGLAGSLRDAPEMMAATWSLVALTILALVIGMVFASRAIFRKLDVTPRPALRAVAFSACLIGTLAFFPHWPAFRGGDFTRYSANVWELASVFGRPARSEAADMARAAMEDADAAIERDQPERLAAALSELRPRVAGQANVFVLGIAGWAYQDVFLREVDKSVAVLSVRLDAINRDIRLVNNRSTINMRPVASVQNLAHVLEEIARRMDLETDVLAITMTSHGSPTGFSLQFGGVVNRDLSPATLKAMLDDAGIRHRIVIVSSCHSGTFVPVLADENTMVITASAATRSSFGCTDTRDLTYFGEAFFARGMNESETLTGAFAIARRLVGEWEAGQGLTPSEPQIHVGAALRARLGAMVGEPEAAQVSEVRTGAPREITR